MRLVRAGQKNFAVTEKPSAVERRYRLNAASPAQHFGRIDLTFTFDAASGRMSRVSGVLLFGQTDLVIGDPADYAAAPAAVAATR